VCYRTPATNCTVTEPRQLIELFIAIDRPGYSLLTAIGLPPGSSSTVHSYTHTAHRTTQLTTERHNEQQEQHN